jgi:uncharacterized protein DUF4136
MKQTITLAVISAIFLLVSCSGIKVSADYDKSVNFKEFNTYSYHGWTKNSDKILSPFDKERIEKSFKDEFDSRGLEFKQEGGDLLIALFIVTEKKTEKVANTTSVGGYTGWGYGGYYGYGPGWGWGAPMMGTSVTSISNYDYTVGTLVCDVFDAKNKKLIWEGVGSGTIDQNPQTREKNIPKSVAAIMAQYPVKPVTVK